jgi:hypothetical protein
VPELSRFFGIVIRMFSEPGAQHHVPHFHAYYQNEAAVFSTSPVDLIAGTLPQKQRRLVEAWAECIRMNCWPTGSYSIPVAAQRRSIR